MPEFFIQANSFAAPFFSDDSTHYVEAETPEAALRRFAQTYKHPCGLYEAVAFRSADDMHKGRPPLARWLSNHAAAVERLTKDRSGYSFLGVGPGEFKIDEVAHHVPKPKEGQVAG